METPPVFGPPILPANQEPADRPLAVALVLDLSGGMYNDQRIIDMFKKSLVLRFANMEYDNVLFLDGDWHQDPGSAVAAIQRFTSPVRSFSTAITEAVKSISTLDRFYRRRLLLVTDLFSVRDVHAMTIALNRNESKLLDIEFHVVGYGPQYSRQVEQCGWNFKHLDEPVEIEPILIEVCK